MTVTVTVSFYGSSSVTVPCYESSPVTAPCHATRPVTVPRHAPSPVTVTDSFDGGGLAFEDGLFLFFVLLLFLFFVLFSVDEIHVRFSEFDASTGKRCAEGEPR